MITSIFYFFAVSLPLMILSFIMSDLVKFFRWASNKIIKRYKSYKSNSKPIKENSFTLKNGKSLFDYLKSLSNTDQKAILSHFKLYQINLNYVFVDFDNSSLEPVIAPTGHLLVSKNLLTNIINNQKEQYSNLSSIH